MTNAPPLHQQLIGDLLAPANPATPISIALNALIEALPYYGDYDFEWAHRVTLANLLVMNVPNSSIAGQPPDISYRYSGSFSGYQSFFFSGIAESAAAANLAQIVRAQNGSIDEAWWGRYGVAVLTDAIRQVLGFNLNTGKLTGDLGSFNATLLPCLTATCFAIYQNGFTPTANALAAIVAGGQVSNACAELQNRILSPAFVANVNKAIDDGGDNESTAMWLLFTLWITLKALGVPDVDAAIRRFSSATPALTVPSQIGPQSWWNGGYTSWWAALDGSDLKDTFRAVITADIPEVESDYIPGAAGGSVSFKNISVPNGYSQSFCYWGSLNWYNPPPSNSCFGPGTGILMSDGSVRPIESVRVGDEVRTSSEKAKVLLIESPPRASRPLYRINHLNLYATATHPFRLAADRGAAHCATEPWNLVDTVPTMVFDGVDALVPGTILAGFASGAPRDITVGAIERVAAKPNDGSCVYDLILERGGGKIAAYYVGGPGTFLAVESEISDGSREPMATVAIIKAMETAIDSCRRSKPDDARLGGAITRLDVGEAVQRGRAAGWSAGEQPQSELSMPGPDFFLQDGRWFLQDGKWDTHASLLGTHLVRRFARMMRRETAMGWRASYPNTGNGDHLTVVLHDLIFVGMGGKISSDPLDMEFRLRGGSGKADVVRNLTVAASNSAHARIVHSIVDFGLVPKPAGPMALIGAIAQRGRPIGVFRTGVLAEGANGVAECFVFAANGHVVGQAAVEPRIGSDADFLQEQQQAERWTDRHSLALAQSLGQQIGAQLSAELNRAGRAAAGPPRPRQA